MSRSFKHKPFMAICGNGSAQYDKTLAVRGVRRAHRQAIHIALHIGDYEVVLPHRLQCTHNEVYSWSRDGNQMWQGEPENWTKEWFTRMMRK